MKILICLTYYSPNISGLTIYARTLAEEMAKRGHQITILTSHYENKLSYEETINGVRVIRIPVSFKIGKGAIMFSLPFYVIKWVNWADVVNCHLPQFESSLITMMAKIFKKKVILTHHTDLSGWKGILNTVSEISVYLSQIIAGFFADSITVYTSDYAEHSGFLKKFANKLIVIYPPVKIFPPDQEYIIKLKREVGEGNILIGYSGRIARQKGLPYLFESIPLIEKKIKNFKIVFAGPYKDVVGENYIENLNEYISKYRSKLIFLGPIPFEKISAFYSIIDVLVLPSDDRLESLGLVQVEAMLQGCPVIATDLPGVRVPINKTGMGIVVKSKDSKNLAFAIVKLLSDRKKYIISKEKIMSVFSLRKTIETYEHIFKN